MSDTQHKLQDDNRVTSAAIECASEDLPVFVTVDELLRDHIGELGPAQLKLLGRE